MVREAITTFAKSICWFLMMRCMIVHTNHQIEVASGLDMKKVTTLDRQLPEGYKWYLCCSCEGYKQAEIATMFTRFSEETSKSQLFTSTANFTRDVLKGN